MEIEFVEEVKDVNDGVDSVMAHAIVGGVVIQLGHRCLNLRRILLQSGPNRKICFIMSSMRAEQFSTKSLIEKM